MTQEHPITLPEEQINRWLSDDNTLLSEQFQEAARMGADLELEACCEWTRESDGYDAALALRADRRPKPPSLKEQALQALFRFDDTEGHEGLTQEQIAEDYVIIRRALESLPE